jgi:hypothetical protein
MLTRKSAYCQYLCNCPSNSATSSSSRDVLHPLRPTLDSVLRTQCAQATESANHEVLEDLVAGLIAGAVLLEAGDDCGVLLSAGAASEGRVELGVRGRGVGAGALLLLHGEGCAGGGEGLARCLAGDHSGEASGDRHGGGVNGCVSTIELVQGGR